MGAPSDRKNINPNGGIVINEKPTTPTEPSRLLTWAVVLDGAGLYVADSDIGAVEIQRTLEYEMGIACWVCRPEGYYHAQ